MISERTRIFSPRLEKFFFLIQGFAFFLMIASFAGLLPNTLVQGHLTLFLTNVVFLNGIHVVFTIIMLFSFPEFKAWMRETMVGKRAWFIGAITLLIVACGLARQISVPTEVSMAALAILFILRQQHNIGQTRGLSLLYNHKNKHHLSETELLLHKRVEKAERWLFHLLLVFVIIARIIVRLMPMDLDVRHWFIGGGVVLGCLFMLNTFRYPQIRNSNKPRYLLNVWVILLATHFLVPSFLASALHGTEYTLLSLDMTARSKVQRSRLMRLAFAAVIVLQICVYAFTFHIFSRKVWLAPSVVPVLVFTQFFIEYFHYYLDGLIFRFSDPAVREHIATLVMPPVMPPATALEAAVVERTAA